MDIKLYNGDCLEVMKQIPDNSVDLVLCDLPYETTNVYWDTVIPFDKLWEMYERVCKENTAVLLFSKQPFTTSLINSNPKNFKYNLIWVKNVPTGMSSSKYRPMKYFEEILVFYKKPPVYNPIMKERVGVHKECYRYEHYCGSNNHIQYKKVKKKYDPDYVQPSDVLLFDVVPNRNGKKHPTQKPVELLEYLIRTYSNEGDMVLDNCMGSGSTGVACTNTGRNFIGIEKEENYFNIAQQRINEVINISKQKLF